MTDRLDIRSPDNGYYDMIYSPHDAGWFAHLLWSKSRVSPTFRTREAAERWALRQGGKQCLRVSAHGSE